ncbi:glycoside hydrolase family 32 protein [Flavobacterium pectinovorum]|uniref:glycoside hydrolase family 32 protein n=1 Tax=Flavobacterium pectinovorum TaxID=29533 RepID=UPI00265EA8C3|nr:glycoside hydrolase family 32 protein [Flavobacterium pectinovorum]WKL49722.1 glycoside hydrolase family 32 protein [Flavobacterium pectinovorum]
MKYRNIIIMASVFFSLVSCSQDDKYIGGSISGGNSEITSVFPVPPAQWMGANDPYYSAGYTGDIMPFFDNGKFHIYFLHDAQNKPAGKGFHDIHEYLSTDLAHFTYEGQMIPYGKTTDPDFAIGTGSVVKVGSLYYFYYTGHNETPAYVQSNVRESVLCATSSDLKNWTKVPSFKITAPAGYYNYDFRDPHVFYNDELKKYSMLVSTQTEPGRKAVLLHFTTADPASGKWDVQTPIYTTTLQDNYLMMECADIFKIGNYWYLIFSENWSANKGTHYRMANSINGPWIKPENDMIDGEYFYAGKTASDGNKRYVFGWNARKTPENDLGNKDWAGNMVIHELTQNTDGTLGVQTPQSVKDLFSKKSNTAEVDATTTNATVNNGSYILSGATEKAMVTFKTIGKKARIKAEVTLSNSAGMAGFIFHTNDTGSYYEIVFDITKGKVIGYNSASQEVTRIPFQFQTNTKYDVEIIAEGSVVVLYINGKTALTNRIYGRDQNKWGLIAEGQNSTFSNLQITRPE